MLLPRRAAQVEDAVVDRSRSGPTSEIFAPPPMLVPKFVSSSLGSVDSVSW